jgi:signal transduction histidine kinase
VVGLTVALGLAALLMALSWGLSRRLNRGVALLEAAGRAKEQELDFPVPHLGVPELDRVGVALERLARTVEAQRADRQALEKKLRHADRLASLGRLVAGMAHELRGPLTGIKLQLDLASRHAQDPARLVGALDTAAQEVDRLNRLVERLLPLSRPSDSARQPTDLHDLLSARLALWSPRAAEAGVKLELGGEGLRGTPVLLDRDRLAQILDNLLANALDALSPRGGCVRVEVSRPSETELWLAVTDDGPGVSPEAGPHLFTPFFTTRDRGTGLGLFLSAELARSMGGELVHSAAPAGGARFELRLPC